jgi:hypothetical protein
MTHETIQQDESPAPLMIKGHFRFQTLEEARSVAIFLAQACPCPRIAIVGLTEVFINAIEHGNLGISSEEKTELQQNMQWIPEIQRRLSLPENMNKFVDVEFIRRETELEIKVTDQGQGFDWQQYQTFESADKLSTHGRGLAMAKDLAFTKQEYSGNGNVVSCFISLTEE